MAKAKRDSVVVEEASTQLHKYPDDFATCWMCWMQMTEQDLDSWRIEPFSDKGKHPSVCPLCGYAGWLGRRWFPFHFLKQTEIGNPSCRYRPSIKPRRKRI